MKSLKRGGAKDGRKKDAERKQMREDSPGEVTGKAGLKQAGEIRARWAWVEPSVWTNRMLAALENGVKGGKWFSLIDKVHRPSNLKAAYRKVAKNKGSGGVDHVSVEAFGQRLDTEIERLHEALRKGTYEPSAVRRVYIHKPGKREKRPLGIPTVRDRVVHTAVRQVIEPIFERTFAACSHGFRPGRGCKDALREMDRYLQEGCLQVVEVDIRKFFDRLDRGLLMERVMEQVADGNVLRLLRAMLEQGVMEQAKQWTPEEGTPQGGPLSPLLANIYLNPLDHLLSQAGHRLIRYADDMVIPCRTKEEAEAVLSALREWMEANHLELHPEKTRVVDLNERGAYVDFLGYRFKRTKGTGRLGRWPSPCNVQRLRANLMPHLRRCNGKSMEEITRLLNPKLRGWFEYFKHSDRYGFDGVDGWIRMRLRSILRKRHKRKGRGRGSDHQCWPNAYFAELGLFSLTAAHVEVRQSARR
jgi:RNA-directed DNA polymerase